VLDLHPACGERRAELEGNDALDRTFEPASEFVRAQQHGLVIIVGHDLVVRDHRHAWVSDDGTPHREFNVVEREAAFVVFESGQANGLRRQVVALPRTRLFLRSLAWIEAEPWFL
jgi:hypothetical protein